MKTTKLPHALLSVWVLTVVVDCALLRPGWARKPQGFDAEGRPYGSGCAERVADFTLRRDLADASARAQLGRFLADQMGDQRSPAARRVVERWLVGSVIVERWEGWGGAQCAKAMVPLGDARAAAASETSLSEEERAALLRALDAGRP